MNYSPRRLTRIENLVDAEKGKRPAPQIGLVIAQASLVEFQALNVSFSPSPSIIAVHRDSSIKHDPL
jgi:hypothetical protein